MRNRKGASAYDQSCTVNGCKVPDFRGPREVYDGSVGDTSAHRYTTADSEEGPRSAHHFAVAHVLERYWIPFWFDCMVYL